MLLLFVICLVAAWVLIALVCVGLCMSAAQGDRGLTSPHVGVSRRRGRFARRMRPAA